MPRNDLTGKVQTVLGPISPEELGLTLTHEHLLIDLSVAASRGHAASDKGFFNRPVSLETLAEIRHYGAANFDNARLLDVDTAIEEAGLFLQYGGGTIVDATSIGIARDPVGLARISRATGVNIVMGASHYIAAAHPADMDSRAEDEIVDRIVRDVTEGVDGTGVKSGVIGEVGCTWPLEDNERKVLRASARAQRLTGAPILIHPGRDETAPLEIMEVLAEAGADLNRTIIGHLDRTVFLKDTYAKIAEAGCYMEWDLFGREASYYTANTVIDLPNDAGKMDDISWVVSRGYGRKVVIAHDICSKDRLQRYGGHGYSYIPRQIVPRMRARGFGEETIHDITVGNPRDILTFVAPERE